MYKFKKNVFIYAVVFLLLISFSAVVPAFRHPALIFCKAPLVLINILRREVLALIFFHRNFIENEKLRKQTGFLSQRLIGLEELKRQNLRLTDLLNLKEGSPYKLIATGVIGRSPQQWSSAVIIDKGYHHGIKRGMAVINSSGLVGKVCDTAKYTATVMLINDPNLGVSAQVARSRQEGLVTGVLGNRLLMKYLPVQADIRPGDSILTSGLTEAYPKGILIGRVAEVGEEYSGVGRYAVIEPAANLYGLEEVMVVVQ